MSISEFKAYFEELIKSGKITSYKYENGTITYRADQYLTSNLGDNGAWTYRGDISVVDGKVRVCEIGEHISESGGEPERMYETIYALSDYLSGFESIQYNPGLSWLDMFKAGGLVTARELNRVRGKISIPDAYKEGLIDKEWLCENLQCWYGDRHESLIEVLEMYKNNEICEITGEDAPDLEWEALLDLATLEKGKSMLDGASIQALGETVLPSDLQRTSDLVGDVLKDSKEKEK